jgi:hypothetical protein
MTKRLALALILAVVAIVVGYASPPFPGCYPCR